MRATRSTGSRPAGRGSFRGGTGKTFAVFQISPLTDRKLAEADIADTDPFKCEDFQTDKITHSANLTISAFTKDEF